jgi:hypothetical protein
MQGLLAHPFPWKQEHLQMRRGEQHQGCEGAACHSVGIERMGNGQVEGANRSGRAGFRAPPGAESG